MRREFNVIIEKDAEGFYVGSVPQLKGCHSQAKSIDELMKRMTEAIELCLEVEKNDPIVSEFVGVQRIVVNA
ncbi:MAG TPA: type II toxin-antitoxin system HicB family antitoxin [Candidatus Ozemobacteraceae bacterium]|nr:type II toxin-antitoxin system HicB family antitoxin [Candidatus Ozemobacteraceae bacterium]